MTEKSTTEALMELMMRFVNHSGQRTKATHAWKAVRDLCPHDPTVQYWAERPGMQGKTSGWPPELDKLWKDTSGFSGQVTKEYAYNDSDRGSRAKTVWITPVKK